MLKCVYRTVLYVGVALLSKPLVCAVGLATAIGCHSEQPAPATRDASVGPLTAGEEDTDARVEMDPRVAIDGDAAPAEWQGDAEANGADAAADGADAEADKADAEADKADAGESAFSRVEGWSVRKRLTNAERNALMLEEVLTDLASTTPKPSRIVAAASRTKAERSWQAPAGTIISDFCVHPSGAASALLLGPAGAVSLVRLDADLTPIATAQLHDPAIANDPNVSDAGALDLVANQLTLDAARIASVGEDVLAAVFTSWNSVVAYRVPFVAGTWAEPRRSLVEPPAGLTPFLPIGGSFDTFGALTAWFRCLLDVDEDGAAYLAVWANGGRIRAHLNAFHDNVAALPGDPSAPTAGDSDVLLTKLAPDGTRLWSRVVGTAHEDEPYALRVRHGAVAVVGRSRRAPGFDNTFWDAFIAVTSTDGAALGTRVLTFDVSSIALAVDAFSEGGWLLGGSDGWSQNPDGLSVLSFGAKLLVALPSLEADAIRVQLPAGPRHNEIRTLVVANTQIAFGGHEDGPVMHTGDSDVGQIHATGVFGTISVTGLTP